MAPPSAGAGRGELSVGRVVGSHGLRGGLRVVLHDPSSDALRPGVALLVRDRAGALVQRAEVERLAERPGHRTARLWLSGVSDRDAAEALRGCEIAVERAELPPLQPDEFYLADVVGRPLLHAGRELGRIVGIATNTAQPLLEVSTAGAHGEERWFLPALPEFLRRVDDAGVHVELPPGMGPEPDEESAG